jgi:hypothetical protein
LFSLYNNIKNSNLKIFFCYFRVNPQSKEKKNIKNNIRKNKRVNIVIRNIIIWKRKKKHDGFDPITGKKISINCSHPQEEFQRKKFPSEIRESSISS